MSILNNKHISLYRDADLEAFYDIAPKHRWNIIFAHMMLHFLPVLLITLFYWSVFEGKLVNHAFVVSLLFYLLVIAETTAYLFPKSRKKLKKYFPWLLIPIFILAGFFGYKVGAEVMGSDAFLDGMINDDPVLFFLGIAGGFGIFVWTYIGMSLVLKASRILYTKRAEMEADVRFAEEVQKRILRDESIEINETTAFGRSLPANELGGDYFELSRVENSIIASVGDISGHSFGAGLLMTMGKSALQTHLQYIQDPAGVMAALNSMLFKQSDRTMYATMTLLNLDLESNKVTLCSAGHPPVFHLSQATKTIKKRSSQGIGLGITDKASYQNIEFSVEKGDWLILYSDGIIEIRNEKSEIRNADFLEQTIQDIDLHSFEASKDAVSTLFDAVHTNDFSDYLEDDATIIAIKI
ncbi:MAG: PP2C family protein-serine/threonine phosphatase [Gracilimonas sp.]|nr:PP2C family protein-serine/threonine phosphatase [Gracilimonas sp.]